jgi:hypothetical protein
MPVPSPHRNERMLIVRVVIALGLAVLLLVGAWSDSHADAATGTSLCVADGTSASSVVSHQEITAPGIASTDAGLLGVCAIVVFLLVLAGLRLLGERTRLFTGRAATASAPPRAGPAVVPPTLSLTQLSISRT